MSSSVQADKQWVRRCTQEYNKLATQFDTMNDLNAQNRLGYLNSYKDQEWQDTANNLQVRNSNPFKNTQQLQEEKKSIFRNSARASEMLFNQPQIMNPVGPPRLNTGDFDYLSSYGNAKKSAEKMNKTFHAAAPGGSNCWTYLGGRRVSLGQSGIPGLTDQRLGQQKLNIGLSTVQNNQTFAQSSGSIMKYQTTREDFRIHKRSARGGSTMAPFSMTPKSSHEKSYKFHQYHLSVNPYETTNFDDSVINNMLNNVKKEKRITASMGGNQELDSLIQRIQNDRQHKTQRFS